MPKKFYQKKIFFTTPLLGSHTNKTHSSLSHELFSFFSSSVLSFFLFTFFRSPKHCIRTPDWKNNNIDHRQQYRHDEYLFFLGRGRNYFFTKKKKKANAKKTQKILFFFLTIFKKSSDSFIFFCVGVQFFFFLSFFLITAR